MKFKLRRIKKGDEDALVKHLNDPSIHQTLLGIPYPYTKKHAKEWIAHNQKLDRQKRPEEMNFAIDVAGEVIGCIRFKYIDWPNKSVKLGYWLAKEFRGQSIVPKALKQALDIAFKKLKLVRAYAFMFSFNKSSKRVMEKAGFRFEGKLRKHVYKDGKFLDTLLYAKVR